MKQKIISTLFFITAFVLSDFLYTELALKSYPAHHFDKIFFVLFSILIFLTVSNLVYKIFFDFKKQHPRSMIFLSAIFVLSMFISDRIVAMSRYYFYSVNISKRSSSGLWKQDDKLGHKAIPGSKGYDEYFLGDSVYGKIPVQFDSLGFRCPDPVNKIDSDTLNLFLGCSWTFGYHIPAEDGYAYKLSKHLNQNFINAAIPAYGLAQMFLLLDTLLPRFPLNYVFIQYSPWLADRATSFKAPSYYEYRPSPYFSKKNDTFSLENIPFRIRKKSKDWRNKKSYLHKLKFYLTGGIEEELINYLSYNSALIKSKLGFINKPTSDKKELEIYFYQHAVDKCRKFNAEPIILKMGFKENQPPNSDLSEFFRKNDLKIIDLDKALKEDTTERNNSRRFEIYHELENGKRIYYDNHPNLLANTIFSNTIYNSLKNKEWNF